MVVSKRHNSHIDLSLCCSFCHKSQGDTAKLISSPSDYPRAYICDECIAVCNAIIEDDRLEDTGSGAAQPHPVEDHPLVPELLRAVEEWLQAEACGRNVSESIAQLRQVAGQLFER